MISIDSISSIPSNAVPSKIGMRSKEIYVSGEGLLNIFKSTKTIAENNKEYVKLMFENIGLGNIIKVKIFNDNNVVSAIDVYNDEIPPTSIGIAKVISDEPMDIKFELLNNFYCIPYIVSPPEIIPIDKAPSTTSLNDITNYINKTTESIKSCKSYIAYVINNKGGSATDTETLESLINKLKDIKF